MVAGSANLFTFEYFTLAKQRLSPGGIFVAWFPLYLVAPSDIKSFVNTVSAVFPHTGFWLTGPELIVAGSEASLVAAYEGVSNALKDPFIRAEIERALPPEPRLLMNLYLMDGNNARLYSAGAPLNTDDSPFLEFSIPRHSYDWNFDENVRGLPGQPILH
jgi:spermidine synthase